MIKFLQRNVIWFLTISLILILFAFTIGVCIKNWPFVKFDGEFSISDVLGFGLTIILAFIVPVWIKHFIDKGNKVNEMVHDEVSRYRNHLEDIHSRYIVFYNSHKLSKNNKVELNVLSEMLDAKFEILRIILSERCKSNAEKLILQLKNKQIELWQCLTGSQINSDDVTEITNSMWREEIQLYQEISEIIVQINLLVSEH